jgi:hypothetical protein
MDDHPGATRAPSPPAHPAHPAHPARSAPTIVAGAEVRAFVARHGGRLYVWTVDHRCCGARSLTLLEAAVTRPPDWSPAIGPLDAAGFELYFDTGAHGRPQELVLELTRRRRAVRAFWNNCAYLI